MTLFISFAKTFVGAQFIGRFCKEQSPNELGSYKKKIRKYRRVCRAHDATTAQKICNIDYQVISRYEL
jgi:hypothetical protein